MNRKVDLDRPEITFTDGTWLRVEQWLQKELEYSYRKLASLNLTESETQQMRGRISLIDKMLDFKNVPAAMMPQNTNREL